MPFAIELYFDAETEKRIRALWDALTTQRFRPERHNASRPHVSLAVSEGVDAENTSKLVTEFALHHERFPLEFSAFGVFPGKKSILYISPKVTSDLLALQRKFLSRYQPFVHGLWEHYLVERWNPHCTLARRLNHAQLSAALDVCRTFELPHTCTVMEIGLVALRPVRTQFVSPFQAPAE